MQLCEIITYVVVAIIALVLAAILCGLYAGWHCSREVTGGGPFRLSVRDPEYTEILEGRKTVEIRPDRPPFNKLEAGDPIVVVRSRPQGDTSEYPGGKYKHDAEIVAVRRYASFDAAIKKEGVSKVSPGSDEKAAAARYAGFSAKDDSAGVVAIELSVIGGGKKRTAKVAKKETTSRVGEMKLTQGYDRLLGETGFAGYDDAAAEY